jgi:hypothetical protein
MAYKSKYTGQQVDAGLELAYGIDNRISTAVSEEATQRAQGDREMADSLQLVENRVSKAEGNIIGLQSNMDTLQTEVVNIKNNEIPQAVAEGIAEVVANAPEDLDTLKEVADYIASDKTKASQIETAISNLQKSDEQLAISIEAKQDKLTLSVLDNGNIRIGNLQGQTKEFMPATPSGDPMHYAYEAIGAEYNATTSDKTKSGMFGDTITHKAGHWYLNEVGDLTNAEMRNIYRKGYALGTNKYLESYFNSYEERTNFSLSDTAQSYSSFNYFLYYSTATIIALGRAKRSALATSIKGFMMSAKSCVKVLNVLVLGNITSAINVEGAFKGANALTYINVSGLKVSISFADSPLLSNASILYMINKELSTSAITITLHADAYARAMADTSITTALTNHPNVTLASA